MISLTENQVAPGEVLSDIAELRRQVQFVVSTAPVVDVHTHLFPPEFGNLFLQGIDDLLNYHYLIAEFFRSTTLSYEEFWKLTKTARADLVWQTMFVDNAPLSEAACGIVSILEAFGLDSRAKDLDEARSFFSSQKLCQHFDRVLEMAKVSDIVMTNDPFNEREMNLWSNEQVLDRRFRATLRIDRMVNEWPAAISTPALRDSGIDEGLSDQSIRDRKSVV